MNGSKGAALVLIDLQQGFDDPYWGRRNNPGLERAVVSALRLWRSRGHPVLHVRHHSREERSPLRADRPGAAFLPWAAPLPGEPVFTKYVNSAFIGTTLESELRRLGLGRLQLAGLTSDHCVSTSARMAANLGFEVTIAADTVATFDRVGFDGKVFPAELIHETALASLNGEFARVVSQLQ